MPTASALGIEPFDDVTGQGSLRYVWFKTNGEDVLVTLVGRVHDDASIRALALVLDVAGVALAENTETGNALRGTRITPLVGAKSITVAEGGVGAEVGPLGFLQPNPGIAARAYASLVRDAEGAPMRGALALDLYAGLGLTTTMLGATFTRVVPCESYAESAEALGIAPSTVEVFLDGVRSGDASALAEASFVVANPPRGGFGDVVVSALTALAFPALSIMSCSPASLARDLAGCSRRLGRTPSYASRRTTRFRRPRTSSSSRSSSGAADEGEEAHAALRRRVRDAHGFARDRDTA